MLEMKFQDTAICLCVDEFEPGQKIVGRAYHSFLERQIEFIGIEELILKMEDLIEQIGYPGNVYKLRMFHNGEFSKERRTVNTRRYYSQEQIAEKKGNIGSFSIVIGNRKDVTWKGRIRSIENNNVYCFYSELELIRIIENELDKIGKII